MKSITRIPYVGKDVRTAEIVDVVLVYLIGYIDHVPHVLLMRRGSHVAYMKNCWSIIAGVVNGNDLLRQAMIEISSETSLLMHSEFTIPQLIGTFTDQDTQNSKIWVRHLMMAEVTVLPSDTPEDLRVRLDWEHSEAVWMPVQNIIDWLERNALKDQVAHQILYEEQATPDFRQNLERMRKTLETLIS